MSSGSSTYAVAQQPLPALPGVLLAPTVGGVDEPDARYQTNEITRSMAVKAHGIPVLLYAPAMPGPALYDVLLQDSSMQRVTSLWHTARAALVGIGARPRTRSSLPSFLPKDSATLPWRSATSAPVPSMRAVAPSPSPAASGWSPWGSTT